jgi:Ala-tRNA(Pro) deacylase
MADDLTIFNNILHLLDENGYDFKVLEHGHVHTSEEAARVRGTKLEEAAKALVLKDRTHNKIFMCVVSGHRTLDLRKIKALLGSKDVSLAHPDEVLAATGCKIGTVPPFPSLFGLDGYCDEDVFGREYVVFSAASHYRSVRMKAEEWKWVAGVSVAPLAKD